VTLAAGEFNPNIDAGIVQNKCALGDFVWFDTNKDGLQQDTEAPLAGVVVTLRKSSDDSVVGAPQTTDAKGFYWFDNLAADVYIVQFGASTGNVRTTAAGQIGGSATGETLLFNSDADATSGRTANIPLAAGMRNPNIDAGYYTTPLPVKLLYVKANADGCTVRVSWATATEQNAKSFEVWRSADGIRYTKIGEMPAAGNSNTPQYYTFDDAKPMQTNYYKLVETDFDGRNETFNLASKVVLNDCNDMAEGISSLYPNPNNTDAVTVRFYTNAEAQTTNFVIYDIVGREMSNTQIGTTTGINTIELDITTLSSGTYTVRVSGDGWYSTAQKLVIVR
jgi:hypothetical protein